MRQPQCRKPLAIHEQMAQLGIEQEHDPLRQVADDRPVARLASLQVGPGLTMLGHHGCQAEQRHANAKQEELELEDALRDRRIDEGTETVDHAGDRQDRGQRQGAGDSERPEPRRSPHEQGDRQIEQRGSGGRFGAVRVRVRAKYECLDADEAEDQQCGLDGSIARGRPERPTESICTQEDRRCQDETCQDVCQEPATERGPEFKAGDHSHRRAPGGADGGGQRHAGDVDDGLAQVGEARRQRHPPTQEQRPHERLEDVRHVAGEYVPGRERERREPDPVQHLNDVVEGEIPSPVPGGCHQQYREDDALDREERIRKIVEEAENTKPTCP